MLTANNLSVPARKEYESRQEARREAFEQLRQDDDRAVNLRMAAFFAGVLCTWVVFGGWQFHASLLLLPVALFIAAVVYHESVQRKKRAAERAIAHYGRCLERLDGNWSETKPDGASFADPEHPYSGDLDLFGPGSLFQLLNSPITSAGERTLADWLAPDVQTALPGDETLLQRQDAVRGLCDQLDLRERLAVVGRSLQHPTNAHALRQWLTHVGGLTGGWIFVVATLLGIAGIGSLIYWFATQSMSALIVVVLAELAFLYQLRRPLTAIKQYSEQAVVELRRIEQVVAALETVAGEAPELQRLRSELLDNGEQASATIHRLERLVSQFENMRRNLFFAPLAFLSMVSLHFACAIDRWRAQHGPQVDRWFEAVGQLETLLAFSQFYYENPSYTFPILTNDAPQFVASQLAHPLLPPGTAVGNDVQLSDDCHMLLVSGSNMSGKSTLMRSVGINAALAWAGAPVFARELKLSRLRVAAAMRVQDSLQTGTSHFMAELQRIRLVVEMAEKTSDTAVLFLLDEILHGTNSHDRLVGARGVIRSLLKADALGIVTTHDLALSKMIAELEVPARNVHFRDQWQDNRMTFDYQMREGVVPKSNALSLMRLLGLEV